MDKYNRERRICRITNAKTGELFVGTLTEYAKSEGIQVKTAENRRYAGRITVLETDEIRQDENDVGIHEKNHKKMPKGYWHMKALSVLGL